jgi:hypothetical protein
MDEKEDFKEQVSKRVAELKTLRDEIRVNLHLATMDLKDEWHQIERKLPDASTAVEQLKDATAEGVDRLIAELRTFRERLRKTG